MGRDTAHTGKAWSNGRRDWALGPAGREEKAFRSPSWASVASIRSRSGRKTAEFERLCPGFKGFRLGEGLNGAVAVACPATRYGFNAVGPVKGPKVGETQHDTTTHRGLQCGRPREGAEG